LCGSVLFPIFAEAFGASLSEGFDDIFGGGALVLGDVIAGPEGTLAIGRFENEIDVGGGGIAAGFRGEVAGEGGVGRRGGGGLEAGAAEFVLEKRAESLSFGAGAHGGDMNGADLMQGGA